MKEFAISGIPAVSKLGPNDLPLSVVVCYILPLGLSSLPAPASIPVSSKQLFIAIWQGWPLYISLAVGIAHSLRHRYRRSRPQQLFRHAYAFALACSVISHVGLLSISFLSISHKSPFLSLHSADLHPRSLLIPRFPWQEVKITLLEPGVLRFLHWDYSISSMGSLLWCYDVYWEDKMRGKGWIVFFSLSCRIATMSLVFGPCSVALALYWAAFSKNLMKSEHVKER
jgi:hypothetical protein